MREFKERKKPSQSSDAFFKPTVQTKLSVGHAGDQYEQEADATADRVVNASNSESASKGTGDGKPVASGISSVQMKEMAPAEDEKAVQNKDEEKETVQKKEEEKKEPEVQKKEETQEEVVQPKEEEEKPIQKKGTDTATSHSVESKLSNRKGKGNVLEKGVKTEMESGFGSDFSDVRIHSDNEASEMAGEMGAQAFTHGNDIYFNEGKFAPSSKSGKHLLAHELTHTIQQKEMQGEAKNFQRKEELKKEDPPESAATQAPAEKTGEKQGRGRFSCDTSANPEFVNRSGTSTNYTIGEKTAEIPFCNTNLNLSLNIGTNTINPAEQTAPNYQVLLWRGGTLINDQQTGTIGTPETHNFGRVGAGNFVIQVQLVQIQTRQTTDRRGHRQTNRAILPMHLSTRNVHVQIHF